MMRWRLSGALLLGLFGLVSGPGWGQQKQAEPTPEHQEKEKQLEELMRQVNQLLEKGKEAEAVPLVEKGVRLEAEVFAKQPEQRLRGLRLLAELHETQQNWKRAEEVRQEVLTLQEKRRGRQHWETLDARLQLQDTQHKKKLPAEQRQQWQQADQLIQQGWQRYQRGDHRGALPLAQQALELYRKVLGEDHPDCIQGLNLLAHLSQALGDYPRALPLFEQARDLCRKSLGENHPSYALSLYNLAGLYQKMGDHSRALLLYEQTRELRQKLLGEDHIDYAATLNSLALLSRDMGNYPRALALYEQVRQLTRKLVGEDHPNYAIILNNLANIHQVMGDYGRALPLLEQARELTRKVIGANHPNYLGTVNNLATLYQDMGDYGKALTLYEEARDLCRKLRGENHPDYALSLNNLGSLYQAMGAHARALQHFEQARDLYKKLVGENHPAYARSLSWLGTVYQTTGDYARALPMFERARDLRRQVLGENHPAYASSLHNLAGLYQDMGDYAKALPLFERARDLRRQVLGENHPDYATSLDNLAGLCYRLGDYRRALTLYQQAHELTRKRPGEDHPAYATGLHNLAMVYLALGDQARALPLFEQALALNKKLRLENHIANAAVLNGLARLYEVKGDHPRALAHYEQARDLCRKLLGENHPLYATSLNNLAGLHGSRGDQRQALQLYQEALRIQDAFLHSSFNILSERQRLALLKQQRINLNNYLAFASTNGQPVDQVYSTVLDWKGLVSARRSAERTLRNNPQLKDLFDRLQSTSARLSQLAFSQPAPAQQEAWKRQLNQLREEKEALERELADKSQSLPHLQPRRVKPAEVVNALPAGTALIDLLAYRSLIPPQQRQGKEEWKSQLLAFVVCQDQPIRMVRFEDAEVINGAIRAWRRAVQDNQRPALAESAAVLQRLLWQPLQEQLGSAKTILIACDGETARFPFAALPGSKPGSFLIEERTIGCVASGKQLVEWQKQSDQTSAPGRGLLAVGGVDYGPVPQGKRGLVPLPGSELEVRQARQLFETAFASEAATLLRGSEPTVARLKEETGKRYRVLHLAIHGLFESAETFAARLNSQRDSTGGLPLEGRSQMVEAMELLPLLKSGLALAGANQGGGVLTSDEVEMLDLEGCQLVTLSACETGLGEQHSGEGVLGLQRAFHAAGARAVCASLWDVNDVAASVLMEQFHGNLWQRRLPPLEALRQAQLFVLKNREAVLRRSEQLRQELVKRGVPAEVLAARGFGKEGGLLPRESKEEPSPTAWWAGFVLSGSPR